MADEPDDEEIEIGFEPESVEACITGDSLFCENTEQLRALAGLPDGVPLMISGFEGAFVVAVPGKGNVTIHDLFKDIKPARKLQAVKQP